MKNTLIICLSLTMLLGCSDNGSNKNDLNKIKKETIYEKSLNKIKKEALYGTWRGDLLHYLVINKDSIIYLAECDSVIWRKKYFYEKNNNLLLIERDSIKRCIYIRDDTILRFYYKDDHKIRVWIDLFDGQEYIKTKID